MTSWRVILEVRPLDRQAPPIPPNPPESNSLPSNGGIGGIGGRKSTVDQTPLANLSALIETDINNNGSWDAADWQAYYDERAAIAEYDGGLSRAEAEALAFESCVAEWLIRNAGRSDLS